MPTKGTDKRLANRNPDRSCRLHMRGKAEAEGKELPYKLRKKLQTKDTAIPSTSGAGRN